MLHVLIIEKGLLVTVVKQPIKHGLGASHADIPIFHPEHTKAADTTTSAAHTLSNTLPSTPQTTVKMENERGELVDLYATAQIYGPRPRTAH